MFSFALLVVSIFRGRLVVPLLFFTMPYAFQLVFVRLLNSGGDVQGLTALMSFGPVVVLGSFVGLAFTAAVPVDKFSSK